MSSTSSSSLPAASSSNRRALRVALDGAKQVLKRRFHVLLLVRDAYERMIDHAAPVQSVRADLAAFLRMLKAWALRQYERMPWTTLLLIASAVVYFVMPVDLIPDMLVGIGFIDDVAVVSTVVRSVRNELDRFRTWERDALPPASPSVSESAE